MDGQLKVQTLLLLLGISAVSGEYLFTIPQVMEAGTTTSFCLMLNDIQLEGFMPEQGYTVTVGLKYMSKDSSNTETVELQTATFGIVNQDGDFHKCQEVNAPRESGKFSAVVNASMTYTPAGEDSEVTVDIFGAEKDIDAKTPNLITLVQTDKPIYKPGQTVKFRVMTMDYTLMSKTDGYQQITIETPNGLRVMQWDNVPSPNGLVSLEMKLSSDPILGSWKIKVLYGSKDIVQPFKVDEYVLPKFEVTITPPKYLLPTSRDIKGTVCAKYTYGKPVKGTLKMKVCYGPEYHYYYRKTRPCAYVTEKIDGCYEFFINADEIELGHRQYSSWGVLKIDANVTEEQTGIELTGHSSGPRLTMYPLNLKLEDDSDNYFKSKFPYNGRVVVTHPDGSPAAGELIRVEGETSYTADHEWANNFTSDENGIVNFVITEFDSGIGYMSLQASAVVYETDYRYTDDELYFRTYTPNAYLRLTKWYSASESYLYIPDVDEAADCDSTLPLDILYTAEAGQDYKFMTIVKAGDAVVYTEEKRIKSDEGVFNLDILSFEETQVLKKELKPTLAPLPSIPPYEFYGEFDVPPEPRPGIVTDGNQTQQEPVSEEIIVPEVARTLGSGEAPRKKREASGTAGCAKEVEADPAFIPCVLGFVTFMNSVDMSDQQAMTSSLCSKEGRAAVQCILDYIKSCPDITNGEMLQGFKMFEQFGGYDVLCKQMPEATDTAGCAKEVEADPAFMPCVFGYSNFMSSMDMSDQQAMTSLMCSKEGLAAVQCILDYIKSCPDLTNVGNTAIMLQGFKMIEEIGGYDVLCKQMPDAGGKSNLIGHFKMNIPITKEMAPSAKVLVFYMRQDKEIVATSLEFKIKNCFKNKVMMSFDEKTVRPGANVGLNLGASPSSTCFVGMVDKSVTLLGGNNQLTPKQVFDRLKQVARPYHYISYWMEDRHYCDDKMGPRGTDEYYYFGHYEPEGVDAAQAFRDVRLWVETDAKLETRPCTEQRPVYYDYSTYDDNVESDGDRVVKLVQSAPLPATRKRNNKESSDTIRSYFPETWLWNIVKLGEDGTLSFETKIPDTITEWVGNTVCTHESDGVGVTELTGVTAFKPFFVSLTLPYSAIRGEILPILATVFNYLSECITLKVQFKETEGFEFSVGSATSREFCLCGGDSESTKFHIIPTVIGEIDLEVIAVSTDNVDLCKDVVLGQLGPGVQDGVQRQLLIEAEGVPQDQTKSSYTCVTDGESYTEYVDMDLPPDMVPDSERATVSVVGDIMGPTLSNLKNLLRMPYGCGEQNMASWSPNIYVLQYLENTDQLTEELEEEAEGYMRVGYQRQMKYRHNDYSYSAWGENSYGNATGSSWLTAFVVKSMAQSSAYIVIDNDDVLLSARWLVSTQQNDGCFPQVGRVFSSYLKGGLDGDNPAGLTAFILIALIEADVSTEFYVNISYGFSSCLDSFNVASTDTYTLSLMFHAYSMYDINGARRAEILAEINKRRVDQGGLRYWRRGEEEKKPESPYTWYRAPSAEVEMTAYVLTSLLIRGKGSIGEVQPIVQWLTKQRNPYGGFSSTQDTVVALKALADFGALTYSGQTAVTIEMINNGATGHIFSVSPSNSLVFQSVNVLPGQGAVEIRTSGIGCALIQVNMKYNVYSEENGGPAFAVKVTPFRSGRNRNNCALRTLAVCTRYLKGGVSNMAIAEVKMLTGWKPVASTLNELVQSDKIQRFEVDNNYVQLYFDELSSARLCVEFDVEQDIEMTPKPSIVTVYDYYETEYKVTVNYTIATTCGTKEEIPLDNEGLDCNIMQCRVTHSRPLRLTCPSCLDTIEDTQLENLVCDAKAVYKATIRRSGMYPVKLMADLRPKKKEVLDKFVNYTMFQKCTCPNLQTGPETKAFIFSTENDFFEREDQIVMSDAETLIPYQTSYEKTIRRLSSKTKLCGKLSRLRRSGSKKNVARLRRLRQRLGVI